MASAAKVTRRVLVVDDEEALAWSLASRLGRMRPDHEVLTANDGHSALGVMRSAAVDLLIADVRMPGMSGIDLVLTARSTRPDLPVVVMTAFASPEVQRLTSGPFTAFLEKPFEFEALLELVDRALTPPKVGFSGAISVQTLPDIVQLYVLSSATGALLIDHHGQAGQVWFDKGTILHAVTGDLAGDEAFYAIMMWSDGDFSMRAGARCPLQTVRSSWQELLIESCRRVDEKRRSEPPPSRTGWTESPPPSVDATRELAELETFFEDFEPRTAKVAALGPEETQHRTPLEVMMNIKDSLSKLNQMDGFVGAALVDAESGMLLGQEGGGGLNLEVAAAGNTEVVKAKRKTMSNLGLKEQIEDILITLNKQYHLIRPLRTRQALFFYVALDRQRANLAMARIALADVEKELTV